jgi:hypothetical protein
LTTSARGSRSTRIWSVRCSTASSSEQVADARRRDGGDRRTAGRARAATTLPARPFAAELRVERLLGRSALVCFDGNRFTVPPVHVGEHVEVRVRLGDGQLAVFSTGGLLLARHRRAPPGSSKSSARSNTGRCSSTPSWGHSPRGRPAGAALAELARRHDLPF